LQGVAKEQEKNSGNDGKQEGQNGKENTGKEKTLDAGDGEEGLVTSTKQSSSGS